MTEATSERLSLYGVIEFNDGGDAEATAMGHNMTREECDQLAALVPAVIYNGSRPVKEAYLSAVPTSRVHRAVDGGTNEIPMSAEPGESK